MFQYYSLTTLFTYPAAWLLNSNKNKKISADKRKMPQKPENYCRNNKITAGTRKRPQKQENYCRNYKITAETRKGPQQLENDCMQKL